MFCKVRRREKKRKTVRKSVQFAIQLQNIYIRCIYLIVAGGNVHLIFSPVLLPCCWSMSNSGPWTIVQQFRVIVSFYSICFRSNRGNVCLPFRNIGMHATYIFHIFAFHLFFSVSRLWCCNERRKAWKQFNVIRSQKHSLKQFICHDSLATRMKREKMRVFLWFFPFGSHHLFMYSLALCY